MTRQDTAQLRRILAEIKDAATDFSDRQPELINRLCDANYLASRALELLAKAEPKRRATP